MNSNTAPVAPAKVRITHSLQQRWKEEAAGFIETGEPDAGIHAYLQAQGCPPRLRSELIRQARASVRGEHRAIGVRLFAGGLAATAAGVCCLIAEFRGVGGVHVYGIGAMKLTFGLLALGVPLLAAGTWKLLSGSTVGAPAAR
jgi:hypothetical protein